MNPSLTFNARQARALTKGAPSTKAEWMIYRSLKRIVKAAKKGNSECDLANRYNEGTKSYFNLIKTTINRLRKLGYKIEEKDELHTVDAGRYIKHVFARIYW